MNRSSHFTTSLTFLSLTVNSLVGFGVEPKEIRTINAPYSRYVSFSPDGKHLAGKVSGRTWRPSVPKIWDVATGKVVMELSGHNGNNIWQLAYSPDGKRLATNDNWSVKVWDLKTKKEICSFNAPSFTRCLVFIDDGKRLATGHDDGRIRLWNSTTGRPESMLRGHGDWVVDFSLSPDGKRLASASIDETARIWNLETSKTIQTFRGHQWYLSSVTFGPKAKKIATGSDDGTARIWDVATGKQLLKLGGHEDWVRDVAISPNQKWIVTASNDHKVRIWTADGKLHATLKSHTDRVHRVVFSPDGKILATASDDNTIKLWNFGFTKDNWPQSKVAADAPHVTTRLVAKV